MRMQSFWQELLPVLVGEERVGVRPRWVSGEWYSWASVASGCFDSGMLVVVLVFLLQLKQAHGRKTVFAV